MAPRRTAARETRRLRLLIELRVGGSVHGDGVHRAVGIEPGGNRSTVVMPAFFAAQDLRDQHLAGRLDLVVAGRQVPGTYSFDDNADLDLKAVRVMVQRLGYWLQPFGLSACRESTS